jgi:hypothetical protein
VHTSSGALSHSDGDVKMEPEAVEKGGSIFDKTLIVNECTPGIYSFLNIITENSQKRFFCQVTF